MLVQRVLMPDSSLESWTVLGDEGGTVEPIERYLAYLTDIERSPNTIKAYAHDLKDWFVFLDRRGLDWREVRLEDLGEFVAWLRLPPAGRNGGVTLLPSAEHHCGVTTVNRKLSAVSGLYVFHARHGVDLGDLVTELQPVRARRTGWKPFLYHLAGGQPERHRTIKLKTPRTHPTILTAAQAQAILDTCTRLRDRFLFALLWETGVRIGEALGLRHEDLAAAEGELTVTPRVNDNRARAKSASPRTVPVGPEIVRLYADYLHGEYGDLDSDYMFVNLWGGSYGRPLTYASVYDLVLRLRRDTGFDFDPHWLRHTRATLLLRQGVPIEVVSTLLGHSSIATTHDIYGHLSVEDARRALEAAGFLTGREVRW
ncbi:integrase [Streptomyces sp. IMTB 2501]|uniref:tyrosine-type recombinase/integrase n=1 Tax=Streptomyces sp. IMTB 2501 TaxID=1776340 RepID=UPI00096F2FD4|nr:tyrosine-type recombinase/integrase [Streptomyces sp. IMTB 2501]OLZ62773.1 integrase [Streptomyces sp. IMTB 2501]